MKVLFLHLSDIHIFDNTSYNELHLIKLVDSLRTAGHIDRMIIIITGDIAQSGDELQYRVANGILIKIKMLMENKKIYTNTIDYAIVPGNHDIVFEDIPRTSEDLNKIAKAGSYSEFICEEIDKQKNFYSFAKKYKCFNNKGLFDRKILNYQGYKIEINLINSAVFSLRNEEDKGLHYIDHLCINQINTPTGADFVISVMHHSPDWYINIQKNQLEDAVLCQSSLVFMGHEHVEKNKTLGFNNSAFAYVHTGGAFCTFNKKQSNWNNSSYEYSILDTESNTYKSFVYKWNNDEQQYEGKENPSVNLPSKPSIEKTISVNQEYLEELSFSHNSHSFFSNNQMDYFVFPRLESENYGDTKTDEFLTSAAFIKEIYDKKRVLIMGSNSSGKTTVLKHLFLELIKQEKCVIFCDISTIKNKDSNKIIKSIFEDIYGVDYSDYVRFRQMAPEKKVLIIDDIDAINQRDLEKYITSISNDFSLMIFASKNIIDLNLLDKMKEALDLEGKFTRYYIKPFFADKRKELIGKLVTLRQKKDHSIEVGATVESLNESINLQKRYISLEPEFIINYVEYFCNNIGTAQNNDSAVFSKTFEANIINQLNAHNSSSIKVDKLFRLLSMLAHFIHFHKAYPVLEKDIINIVNKYNDEDDDILPSTFLRIIESAKIIVLDGRGYRFVSRNHLSFFVAREVNFQYNATGNEDDLNYLLRYACFGINADILMFITYITDNPRILQLILNITEGLICDWDEFDLENNLPRFLQINSCEKPSLPDPKIKESLENDDLKEEKEVQNRLETKDIYDYNEEESEDIFNQIARSLSLLTVVAKCLPGFEHIMLKPMKTDFVKMIYSLPNKIYGAWAKQTDAFYDDLIDYLVEQGPIDYHNQKKYEKSVVIEEFQKAAISLLLDIYNIAATYATKDNSFRLLKNFDTNNLSTYDIEKLMIIEKSKNGELFVDKAIEFSKNHSQLLPSVLIQYIAKHAAIHMKSLNFQQQSQLSSAFFMSEKDKRTMLIKRHNRQKHKE